MTSPRPYAYQVADIADLAHTPRRLLTSEPGTGKTMIAVRAMETYYANDDHARILIICSKVAMHTWKNEIEMWGCGRPVVLLPEGKQKRLTTLAEFVKGWLVINRESLRLLIDDLNEIGFYGVIVDECHNFRARPLRKDSAKSGRSQATAALFKLKARVQWAISATLTDGDPRQAWPILHWLWPKQFSGFWKFALQFCEFEPNQFSMYGDFIGPRNLDELHKQLAPLMIRRLKSEVAAELPAIVHQRVEIELSPQEQKHYASMEETMLAEFSTGIVAASAVVAKLTRLQQITTSIGTFEPKILSTKIAWVLDYIEGVPQHQQLVIASRFRDPLMTLYLQLNSDKCPCGIIASGIGERAENIDKFQRGELRVLFISVAAGGESITLSAADTMIVLDLTWSSIEFEQLINRIHRVDSHTRRHKSINIIRLVARNTIDVDVEKLVLEKTAINNQMILSTLQASLQARAATPTGRTHVLKIDA